MSAFPNAPCTSTVVVLAASAAATAFADASPPNKSCNGGGGVTAWDEEANTEVAAVEGGGLRACAASSAARTHRTRKAWVLNLPVKPTLISAASTPTICSGDVMPFLLRCSFTSLSSSSVGGLTSTAA